MDYAILDTVLWGVAYSTISFCFFTGLNWVITRFLVPEHIQGDAVKEWRWRNYAVSFVHSSLSGSFAVLCVLLSPGLLANIISGYSEMGYFACCISYGYFWYDTFDLINNRDKDKGNRELVVHHAFALTSASLVVFTKTFVGFGAGSLLIELHSMTLHMRVLLKMYTCSQTTTAYQLLKVVNMVTFFTFRFGSLFYLVYALFRDRYSAPHLPIYLFMCMALSVILFLSCLLFMRVIRADFMAKKSHPIKTTDELLVGVTPLTVTSGNQHRLSHG